MYTRSACVFSMKEAILFNLIFPQDSQGLDESMEVHVSEFLSNQSVNDVHFSIAHKLFVRKLVYELYELKAL